MKEKDYQSLFNKWVKNVFKQTAAFELKHAPTGSLPFSAVQPHQLEALMNVKYGTFVFKIPDVGYQNPFDSFSLHDCPAYVVIKYPECFELIDVETFIYESKRNKRNKRKSLTASRAKEISITTIKI